MNASLHQLSPSRIFRITDKKSLRQKVEVLLEDLPELRLLIQSDDETSWQPLCGFDVEVNGSNGKIVRHSILNIKITYNKKNWGLCLHLRPQWKNPELKVLTIFLTPVPSNFRVKKYRVFIRKMVQLIESAGHMCIANLIQTPIQVANGNQEIHWRQSNLVYSSDRESPIPERFFKSVLHIEANIAEAAGTFN